MSAYIIMTIVSGAFCFGILAGMALAVAARIGDEILEAGALILEEEASQ